MFTTCIILGLCPINTDTPRATLDVVKNDALAVNGVIFPNLTTEQRDAMQNIPEGTTIFNTTTKCLEYWDATEWVCTKGSSIPTPAPEPEPPMTTFQLTLTNAKGTLDGIDAFFVSVNDNDYLPYRAQTDAASTSTAAADGTADKLIDFQGGLGAGSLSGETKTVPLRYNCQNGPCSWEAFIQTVTINSQYLESGSGNQITFTIPAGNVQTGEGDVEGTLTAATPVKFKKLDLNKGLGSDKKGITVADFSVRLASSPVVSLKARLIPAVVDAANKLAYIPMNAQNSGVSQVALNLDLGAEYADMTSPYFNPTISAKQADKDFRAFGHLFQWQRKADGHQKIKWTSATSFNRINLPTSSNLANDWTNAGTTVFITNSTTNTVNVSSWVNQTLNEDTSGNKQTLWMANGNNNPCPGSFHVPTKDEVTDLLRDAGINQTLQLSGHAGERSGNPSGAGVIGFYWSSTPADGVAAANNGDIYKNRTSEYYFTTYSNGASYTGSGVRAKGMAVRCVSDK